MLEWRAHEEAAEIVLSHRSSGEAQLLFGAFLISFSPVFVNVAGVGPTVAGFYRCLFGGAILLVLIAIRGEPLWIGRGPFLLALAAASLFATDLTFWHRSILYIGPGLATIMANFEVFFLAAFGVLVYRERVDWKFVVSIPLAVGGLFVLVGVDWNAPGSDYRRGVYFGLIAAMAYSFFMLVLQRSQSRPSRLTPASNLAVVSLAVAAIMGVEARLQGEAFRIPDLASWAAMLAYGVLCQAVGWIAISRGLARVEASRAGLIMLLQPTLAFVWDWLLFDRPTDAADAGGALLTLGAIYLGGRRPGVDRTAAAASNPARREP